MQQKTDPSLKSAASDQAKRKQNRKLKCFVGQAQRQQALTSVCVMATSVDQCYALCKEMGLKKVTKLAIQASWLKIGPEAEEITSRIKAAHAGVWILGENHENPVEITSQKGVEKAEPVSDKNIPANWPFPTIHSINKGQK